MVSVQPRLAQALAAGHRLALLGSPLIFRRPSSPGLVVSGAGPIWADWLATLALGALPTGQAGRPTEAGDALGALGQVALHAWGDGALVTHYSHATWQQQNTRTVFRHVPVHIPWSRLAGTSRRGSGNVNFLCSLQGPQDNGSNSLACRSACTSRRAGSSRVQSMARKRHRKGGTPCTSARFASNSSPANTRCISSPLQFLGRISCSAPHGKAELQVRARGQKAGGKHLHQTDEWPREQISMQTRCAAWPTHLAHVRRAVLGGAGRRRRGGTRGGIHRRSAMRPWSCKRAARVAPELSCSADHNWEEQGAGGGAEGTLVCGQPTRCDRWGMEAPDAWI